MGIGIAAAAIGSALLNNRATRRAADTAAGASREALDLQREIYNQNRDDLAPYRETGTAALGQLAQLLGISAPQAAPVAETVAPPTGEYTLDPAQLAQVLQPYLEGNPAEISQERQYILDNFPELVQMIDAPEPTVTLSPVGATSESAPTSVPEVEQPVLTEPATPDYSAFFETPGYQFTLNEALTANEGRAAARGRLSSSATDRSNIRYATGLADQTYNNYLNRLASMAGIGQTANTATAGLGANFANSAGTNIANAGTARASGYLGQANTINNALNSYMNYSAYNNLANSLYNTPPSRADFYSTPAYNLG
ncbi:MAG: hypothetical protein N0C84_05890 [Candidatus Thiodiazotropha taylori]|uniref:Uncharacterized protein n=1 Tax=Candidatus Thiodiazotropha taylori TaxID=2792791 RepID=A0A9E4N3L2_9GAMM|nr:hypothetical protein [Candidatus Thiodiazotropha taylori]MCW4255985.1 hypothetical protein [Candidatus Thiodiazotropha taylori]